MPGTRDIVYVADKIVAQLKADLPARLDTLDAEYSDGIVLADIPTNNYFVSERRKPPGFPMVAVIPDRTDQLPFSGEFRYNIEYHYLTIAVYISSSEDEDILKRRTSRTIRGIEEVLLNARTLGASVDDVLLLKKEYSPMLSRANALLQEARQNVRVMTRPN